MAPATVRGGAFCHLGDTGTSVRKDGTETPMVCERRGNEARARWRRAGSSSTPTTLIQPERPVITRDPHGDRVLTTEVDGPRAPASTEPVKRAERKPKVGSLNPVPPAEPEFNTPEYWRQAAERARKAAADAMAAGRVDRSQRAQRRAEECQAKADGMDAYRAKATPVDGPPVTGERDHTLPLDENGWGYRPWNPTAYHPDGPIGCAVADMRADKYMLVDGQPLANVLGRTATDVVAGRRTPQEGLDAYKTILGRLPEGSEAHYELADAIRKMDGPAMTPPQLPAEVPAPLHRLMRQLHTVPLYRADPKEIPALKELCDAWMTGDRRAWRLPSELRNTVYNRRHESLGDCGKLQADEMVIQAVNELEDMPRDQLIPPPLRNR